MAKTKCYLLFFLSVFLSIHSYGQYFKTLDINDGLSNLSVLSICQDTLGRMWFGTNEGVNVYDGNQILKYKYYDVVDSNRQKNKKFINGTIGSMVCDASGDVFIKNDGILMKYDMEQDFFKELYHVGSGTMKVWNGDLWFTVADSLFRYDNKKDFSYFHKKFDVPVIVCMEREEEKLWLGTTKGLYIAEKENVRCVIPEIEISDVFLSSRGELWIASRTNGLYKRGRDEIIKKEINSPTRVISNQIREFIEDNRQNIWFGTFDGLQVYNPYTDTYSAYFPDYRPGSLRHKSVFSLYKDRQGTLWIGTYYGGVNYFNQEEDIFKYYSYDKSNDYCLNFPLVGQMVEDKNHNLWIATDGGGINCLDRKQGTFTYYTAREDGRSILHNNVKAIAYDKLRNRIYVGTYTGGLSSYDISTHTFHNYLDAYKRTDIGPNHIILSLKCQGDYLYVMAHNGFWRLNLVTDQFELITDERFFHLFEVDSHGYVWFGDDWGVFRLALDKSKEIEPMQMKKSGSPRAKITRILEVTDGTIYVSTLGDGVYSYNYANNEWKHYNSENSKLLSDFCYNIVETSMNHVLITNDEGFSIYSPFNRFVYSVEFGHKGLVSGVANNCGLYVSEDNLIYIGGVNGLMSFKESDLYKPGNRNWEFYFSNLIINNVKVYPGDEHCVLEKSLSFVNHIDLESEQNNLVVDFSNSNYVETDANTGYEYKLENFDKRWLVTKQARIAYTNLAPGSYILKVREVGSSNQYEDFVPKEISLSIKIHQPWYFTGWAFGGYILFLGSLSVVGWRIHRTRQQLALSLKKEKDEKERMGEINRTKLRFFTNISHEFRTPLTLIIGQIEIMLYMEKISPSIQRQLRRVYRNAVNLRFLVGELLDFRKQEQGFVKLKVGCMDFIYFVKDIYSQFIEIARKKNITYTFEHIETEVEVWFDPIQMQKVVFNLLSNAFKYTPEGKQIKVTIKRLSEEVELSVADTGCGMPEKVLDKIFDRFFQINETSKEGMQGSGIGLALAKSIVDSHKGTVSVDSKENEGSVFKVRLKLGNNHFTHEELEHEKIVMSRSEWNGSFIDPTLFDKEDILTVDNPMEGDEKPSILLVEDDEDVLEMLNSLFSSAYTVYKANDGQKGFEMAQQLHPDLVVSDVMMPVMSGKELCYKIKNCLELAYTPVILLTAQASVDYTIEGYMFGADDYITKPFNVKLLLARCNNLLKNKRLLLNSINSSVPVSQVSASTIDVSFVTIVGNEGLTEDNKNLLDKAIGIIKENLDNPDFDMNMLADGLNMSRSKMFVVLKGITGLTPNELTLKLKMEEALRRLKKHSEFNISEISYQLGFSNPRYFSKCFKDFYGITPQGYRKELQNK